MEQILKILSKIRDILKNQDEINSILGKRLDDLECRVIELEKILYSKDD